MPKYNKICYSQTVSKSLVLEGAGVRFQSQWLRESYSNDRLGELNWTA